MKRRDFFTTAASGAFPLIIPSRAFGANDRIEIGLIGLGGRCKWIMTNEGMPGAQVVAVADCFAPRLELASKWAPEGDRWRKYRDYRSMFDREKLDAVFVETTTHARVLTCIHALQAGLDVYAEKPLTLTVAEGRTLVNAVRKHKRVLQTGTQQRSIPINVWGSRLVREGAIGKVKEVIACNFIGPKRWTPQPAQPAPEGLDWDQWCNQTELRPYHKELHFKWADWWDNDGGGQSWGVSGWGTHSLDQVQTALGADHTGPVEMWCVGSGPECKVTMRYAGGTLLKLEQPIIRDHQQLGAIFIGEKGKLQILRGSLVADPPELIRGAPPNTPEGPKESVPHIQNFFDSMRARQKPNADVEIGHRSNTVCHLVNICRELQRRLTWDPKAERFMGDDQANTRLSRPRRKGYELPGMRA